MNPSLTLANLIFPEVKATLEDLEKRFPPRNLPLGAQVTRFAPSPTGFLHTGSLYTAMVGQKVANQSKGVFFLRLEDTDTKREIAGSGELLFKEMATFGVIPDEGYFGNDEKGAYGPYRQSQRALIYKTVIRHMIITGCAYPCFCSNAELDELRARQEEAKVLPGYYGPYAKYRDYPLEKAIEDVKSGKPFVMRFKSTGDHRNFIKITDLIRGQLSLSENDQDLVILKSDGLPTYHFAHVVDDHFMRTTIVSRGEEWLPSLPIHLQMFASLGWNAPSFAHLPVIMKLDNGSRRKLSKRKDSEAAVSFFLKDGYPISALKEYLMILANSNYEEWRIKNPDAKMEEFPFSFERMALDGALFDLSKIEYLSKEIISKYTAKYFVTELKKYSHEFDPKLAELISRDEVYFTKVINIEREKENPRKDFVKYADVFALSNYFYRDYYKDLLDLSAFNPLINHETIARLLIEIKAHLDLSKDENTWFSSLKDLSVSLGFAPSGKDYKLYPSKYLGHVGDVAECLRLALTSYKRTPNLYLIMQVLGQEEIAFRLNFVVEKLTRK